MSRFERLRRGLSLAAAAAILVAFARIVWTIPVQPIEIAAVPVEPLIVDNSNKNQVELRSGPVRVLWLNDN